ncbi:hypothetical protein FH508_0013310 [Lysinibacillus sp. CD3-6]|uniref:hypothetical protein n=1 Tax=Lysinibacillus sp. CD3-6 TaxID=2892541 RepID=UPI001D17B95E|nr:hypothetical protein [Lysinibacillus sp. CD3-6]UED78441.1 hypothetical protein FH508_0013310 [Lysinibacillus sp. CD3-6]
MLKERTLLNRYQLDKAIKNYHDNMRRYMRMKDELESLTATASTVKYGIEATMPKAIGKTRDPVYAHVQIRASCVVRIEKIKNELLMVQHLTTKVTGDVEQEVLYLLLEGKPFRWIGAKLNMSHTSVQRVRERVIDLMMK